MFRCTNSVITTIIFQIKYLLNWFDAEVLQVVLLIILKPIPLMSYLCPLGQHNYHVCQITQWTISISFCLRFSTILLGLLLVLFQISILWLFEIFRVILPKPIWVLKIVEYSMNSIFDHFEDTLANIGLLELWIKWYYNDLIWIKNKSVKRESNWIGKKLSQIESKTGSQIK